jgi:hypothetical protein
MITDIPNNEFIKIRNQLDSFPANNINRSVIAQNYLLQYRLPEEVPEEQLLKYFFGGDTPQAVWKWLYILERSIPYYTAIQPEWQKRLLYFPATYIVENYLNRQSFIYNGVKVMLRFTRISGDHDKLHAGPNEKSGPDFYIYTDTSIFVEYKFASKNRFTTVNQVVDYYSSGNHMHKAKILITLLESENRFYLIDYLKNEYYPLNILPPGQYISSDDINCYTDPLEILHDEI